MLYKTFFVASADTAPSSSIVGPLRKCFPAFPLLNSHFHRRRVTQPLWHTVLTTRRRRLFSFQMDLPRARTIMAWRRVSTNSTTAMATRWERSPVRRALDRWFTPCQFVTLPDRTQQSLLLLVLLLYAKLVERTIVEEQQADDRRLTLHSNE